MIRITIRCLKKDLKDLIGMKDKMKMVKIIKVTMNIVTNNAVLLLFKLFFSKNTGHVIYTYDVSYKLFKFNDNALR